MQVTCGTWRMWAARTACAVAAVLAASGPARAFYWYDWPGSGLKSQGSLVPQSQNSSSNPPSGTQPSSPGGQSPPPDGPPPGQPTAPEPGTGLLGVMGLGVLAAARRWRKP
ncbi:PEP-CTERM sorting domain-containing protein [Frigoriglobus tundricola]|uniref:PEP-CTERM sorting domain-containing protein n=1 Tax=Frigoriglobus tundricola TaxID=2774151 RepID=UPI00148EBA98